jgi:hypothetical protein
VVAGLLLAAAPLSAAEESSRPPASALGLIRDMRLTVLARRAFQNDRVLGPLNLGVKVRDGVATVWGPVPSPAAARQAVARLEAINGIYEVKSEMHVRRPTEKPLLAELGIPARAPTRIDVAKPDDRTGSIRPPPREPIVAAGDAQRPGKPGNLPELRSVPMLPQPPPRRDTTTSRPAPVPLSVAVQRVRSSELRYRAIPVEVHGNVVIVRRTGAADEDVTALAQALRRVRGVAEVIVTSE